MILIADSGSTKTEWCVAENGREIDRLTTQGTNPFFQTPEEMDREVTQRLLPWISGLNFDEVWFYGAGCAFAEQTALVREILGRYLPDARIEVGSDMLAAARALCGHTPGIACILGTGSNSCWFDGEQIVSNVSPLGFILGDEGSGAVLGRLLLGDYLKNQLPEPLREAFREKYPLTPAEILDRVYKKPFPNRFLAGFAPFLAEHAEESTVRELVKGSFATFFRRNVVQYPPCREVPVHFTGSVAFYFRELLEEVAAGLGVQVGTIIRSPMTGLVRYHSKGFGVGLK